MQLVQYSEDWLKIGRSTEPINKKRCADVIKFMYSKIGQKEPYFWFCDSPMQIQLILNILRNQKLMGKFMSKSNDLRGKLRENLQDNLRGNLWDKLGKDLQYNCRDKLWRIFWGKIREDIGNKIEDDIRDNIKGKLTFYDSYFYGQFESYFAAYYQFPEKYLGVTYTLNQSKWLTIWAETSKSCSFWYPFKNICFISERPKYLSLNEEGKLHNDRGPAIKFKDGYEIWYLNGIRIKKGYVMIDSEKMEPEMVLKEKNVDCRRELLRKIGVERMAKHGKLKHKAKGYQLINMSFFFKNIKYAPYLLMENPSLTGVMHMEGVHPKCKTVEQAINWRKYRDIKKKWKPENIT